MPIVNCRYKNRPCAKKRKNFYIGYLVFYKIVRYKKCHKDSLSGLSTVKTRGSFLMLEKDITRIFSTELIFMASKQKCGFFHARTLLN